MSRNKHVADHVVEIAARLMHHPDPEVRELAGEVMRLSQNRPPVGSLAEYNALTIARRYAERGKSVFDGTILEDLQRNRLVNAPLSVPDTYRRTG